jgi:hypothetical protein
MGLGFDLSSNHNLAASSYTQELGPIVCLKLVICTVEKMQVRLIEK